MKFICNLIFIFLLNSYFVFSQNLVINPSFEENRGLQKGMYDFDDVVKYWKLVKCYAAYLHSGGDTTTYYAFAALKNMWGTQPPHFGDAYIMMTLVDGDAKETGTLVQGVLTEPLKAGKCYYAEVYLSRINGFNYTSNFEFIFSDTLFNPKLKNVCYQKLKPNVSNPLDNFLRDSLEWMKVSGVFKAKGGEKYLLMGNTQKYATIKYLYPDNKVCGYYVDDVLVKELPFCPEDFETDSIMTFNNLNFQTGKAVILSSSFEELNKLVEYLKIFENNSIKISGHTDNIGTETKNQALSEQRAKAVADYLISQGIDKKRITSAGYGSIKPIEDNKTEEGRAKNRRVEFELIKN